MDKPEELSVNRSHSGEDTASSLLDGLRNDDANAWARLVDLWTPLIYGQCRRRGLKPNDADDTTQNVLVRVYGGLSGFERDGAGKRFRYWIMAILRNEIAEFCRRGSKHPAAVGGSDYNNILNNISDVDEESQGDWCHPAKIVARALDVIKGDFKEMNWNAFQLVVFKHVSNQEAGERLGMTTNAVRQATFRIRQRLETELEGMLD